MRKTFSAFRLALSAICVLGLFGSSAFGQGREIESRRWAEREQAVEPPSGAVANQNGAVEHPNGIVQDWSHRHAVYPRFGPLQTLIALQNDPRALHSWQAAARREWRQDRMHRHFRNRDHDEEIDHGLHPDWNISLGSGTTAPAMYPAKFTFDTNAVANCTTDFVVFPVNATGGAAQPNIVGFNNLYSGAGGACNAPQNGRTSGPNDDGVSATTIFSYNVHAAGGKCQPLPPSPWTGPGSLLSNQHRPRQRIFTSLPGRVGTEWPQIYRPSLPL